MAERKRQGAPDEIAVQRSEPEYAADEGYPIDENMPERNDEQDAAARHDEPEPAGRRHRRDRTRPRRGP